MVWTTGLVQCLCLSVHEQVPPIHEPVNEQIYQHFIDGSYSTSTAPQMNSQFSRSAATVKAGQQQLSTMAGQAIA